MDRDWKKEIEVRKDAESEVAKFSSQLDDFTSTCFTLLYNYDQFLFLISINIKVINTCCRKIKTKRRCIKNRNFRLKTRN
jgi:hypothetical protein